MKCPVQLNAIANRAAGKGYENEDNYANIKFQFIGIENIHVMRNSQQKMIEGNLINRLLGKAFSLQIKIPKYPAFKFKFTM